MSFELQRASQLILVICASALLLSCGSKKDPGAHINIEVTPQKAYIVPGSAKSCLDKVTGSTSYSVSENRVLFTNFRLKWNSTEDLTVFFIRVTIEHSDISGGSYTATIGQDELEAMFARSGSKFSGSATETVLDTSDTARGTSGTLPACGLHFGGIQFASKNPTPFSAGVTIEIVGVSENANGDQSPVRKKIHASAEYY
jgi:hypothetical protein